MIPKRNHLPRTRKKKPPLPRKTMMIPKNKSKPSKRKMPKKTRKKLKKRRKRRMKMKMLKKRIKKRPKQHQSQLKRSPSRQLLS